ncbi:hypothetical protein VTO73DRAFT_3947 [Trametes versicolor]
MIDKKLLYGPLYGLPDPGVTSSLDQDILVTSRGDIATRILSMRPRYFALQALWNATAPINKLPNEILLEIISLANPRRQPASEPGLPPVQIPDPYPIGVPCWLPLMLVCRHWYAIILSNTRLWRAIDIYRNPNHFIFALKHSGKTTFDLAIHYPRATRFIVPALAPIASRLSKLLLPRLCCGLLRPVFLLLLESWPRLEGLTVLREPCNPQTCSSIPPMLEFPLERFPMLSTLRLSAMAISWNTGLISRMRRLELSDCSHAGPQISFDAFLDVCEACPDLEELRMHNFLSTACSDRSRAPRRTVALPKLKDFGFRDEPSLVSQLLSNLHLPYDARIHIGSDLEIRYQDDLDPGEDRSRFDLTRLLPKDRSRLPMSRILRRAKVEVVAGLMRIVGMDEETYFVLDFDTDFKDWMDWPMLLSDAVEGLVKVFGNCDIGELEIVGGTSYFQLSDHVDFLMQFTNLEVLRIEGTELGYFEGGHELRELFDALADVMEISEGKLLCPRLRSLSLVGVGWVGDSLDSIGCSLQFRAEHGSVLEELHLELSYEGLGLEDDFETFKARFYAELCALIPGGSVTMTRAAR